jgi:hypothetical protein
MRRPDPRVHRTRDKEDHSTVALWITDPQGDRHVRPDKAIEGCQLVLLDSSGPPDRPGGAITVVVG